MGLGNYLTAGAGIAGAALEGQQKGQSQQRQTLMDQIRLAIQQKQMEDAAALRAAQLRHTNAETDALTNKPAPRDPVADANAKWDYRLKNPLPTGPKAPVMGSPEWLNAQDAAAKIRAKYRAPTNASGQPESSEIAASRRDLKGFQSQQIRAEREVSGLGAERKGLLARHFKADRPLSMQKNAADSTSATEYSGLTKKMSDAQSRVDRLAHSADSTQSVINQRRAGAAPPASLMTPEPDEAPPMDHAAIVARANEENNGYVEAVKHIKASVTDPTAQRAALAEAQRIYMQRIQAVNAGREPE